MKAIFTQDFANNWRKNDEVEIKVVYDRSYLVDEVAVIDENELKEVADIYDDNGDQISKGSTFNETTNEQPIVNKTIDIFNKIKSEIESLDYDIDHVDYDYDDMACTEEIHTICREEVIRIIDHYSDKIQKAKEKHCKWIKYNDRTICPKEHDINNPYWRIPENRKDVLKYCPYCGLKVEIDDV